MTGRLVGLLISAMARSEEVPTALVTIAVMPQIILSGAIAPRTGLAKGIAAVLVVYRGHGGLQSLLPESGSMVSDSEFEGWAVPFLLVLAHAVIVGVATMVVPWSKKDLGER